MLTFLGGGIKKKTSSKTARLEEKLDGLVSLLTTVSAARPQADQANILAALAQFGASPESPGSPAPSPRKSSLGGTCAGVNQEIGLADSGQPSTDAQYHMSKLFSQEANQSLEIFRSQMLPYIPFIILPDSTTPEQFGSGKSIFAQRILFFIALAAP